MLFEFMIHLIYLFIDVLISFLFTDATHISPASLDRFAGPLDTFRYASSPLSERYRWDFFV